MRVMVRGAVYEHRELMADKGFYFDRRTGRWLGDVEGEDIGKFEKEFEENGLWLQRLKYFRGGVQEHKTEPKIGLTAKTKEKRINDSAEIL